MKNPRHTMIEVDPEFRTGICAACGPVELWKKAKRNPQGFLWQCGKKRQMDRQAERSASQKTRIRVRAIGPVCERCGFVPEDACQLQVDHIVPRWKGGTNARDNLQTLCCNCHALKTKEDTREWRSGQWMAARKAGLL